MGGDVDHAVTKLQALVRIPTVSYRDWDAIDAWARSIAHDLATMPMRAD